MLLSVLIFFKKRVILATMLPKVTLETRCEMGENKAIGQLKLKKYHAKNFLLYLVKLKIHTAQ